jgi:hypothetical protein
MVVTIERQIACARRELTMRRVVYPKLVAAGKMAGEAMVNELAEREAIIKTLERVAAVSGNSSAFQNTF